MQRHAANNEDSDDDSSESKSSDDDDDDKYDEERPKNAVPILTIKSEELDNDNDDFKSQIKD